MAFDGIVTKSVIHELKENLLGGRVNKIYQTEKDEILLHIYNNRENYKLLISSSSNNPRFYLTDNSKENPAQPPMFCMILRKHLMGGTILNIEQFKLDRIIFIDISSRDELGRDSVKRIVIEIMGRHSNIILIDKESSQVIDSAKRVYEDMSRVRQIFPGGTYELPPLQDKSNPLDTSKDEFLSLLNSSEKDTPVFKFLYFNYLGLSPLVSREICFQGNVPRNTKITNLTNRNIDSLYKSFNLMMKDISEKNFKAVSVYDPEDENKILAFYTLDIDQYGLDNKNYFDSISKLLDDHFHTKDVLDRIGQRSQSIRRSVQVKLDRSINKLRKQRKELQNSRDREKYKVYADLISANIHQMNRGLDTIELENFYDENMALLRIPLDHKLSPVANAQKYYKKYSRLKNANSLLSKQIPETENEISYLEHVLMSIENSSEIEELEEIREELIHEGYLKDKSKKKKMSRKKTKSKPHHYLSQDGFNIFVGKNNRQNDKLTMRFAHKEDIWLHVQNMPGSHVIIQNQGKEVPETTLTQAGTLASYYSKARDSNNVPVDYTERKNVRKPRNAKTGMVIYDNHKTLAADPSRDLVRQIEKLA